MTNPTTPFSWQMPTSTDLVTDLPADFETFGQAVATSMADLLGGTTGQILSKASNTDMDFTWITNDVGDITAVNTTAPLAGGGTSGALTLSIAAATTSVVGAVQLSDSTSTTSSVLAATPTAVKSAYDLANGAIAKTTVTTAGDIIYRNATVPTRLGIGTAGQVLQVNSGATAPEWATPSSGGMTLLSTTTLSGSTTSITSISSSYVNLLILIENAGIQTTAGAITINFDSLTTNNFLTSFRSDSTTAQNTSSGNVPLSHGQTCDTGVAGNSFAISINNYANGGSRKPLNFSGNYYSGGWKGIWGGGGYEAQGAVGSCQIKTSAGTFSGGTVRIYGVK